MASTTHLNLFPSSARPLPRKSSLKKPQTAAAPIELRGLALQVTSVSSPAPKVLPASDHIKHSLFYGSPTVPEPRRTTQRLERRPHARRRSSATSTQSNGSDAPPAVAEDQLSPLPVNTHFSSSSPPRRHPASQLKRPNLPWSISVEAQPDAEQPVRDDDRLSPLPEKTRFVPASPRMPEYPAPLSERSVGTAISRSNSAATSKATPSPGCAAPMRSMFPQYDPSKPSNAQSYYPSAETPAQRLPSEKISKVASPVERPALQRFDSGLASVDGYEHIPAATSGDLIAIWDASHGQATACRRVQCGLYQSKGDSASLAIGGSAQRPLYSVERALPQSPSQKAKQMKHLAVEKHSPRGGPAAPVAQLALPTNASSEPKGDGNVISIFPQAAAIQAIETIANSPAAAEIATFDPTAKSPEAARLAQDAVAEAHRRYGCELTRVTRKRDSLGAITAMFNLEHPTLGPLPITVTKSTKQGGSREPRIKIGLHHPSATPAAVAAETLLLAFLDFSRDACVVDMPGLIALDCRYIIDTALTALLAVAAIENDTPLTETLTFEPPPKSPYLEKKTRKSRSYDATTSRKWRKRSSKAIDKVQRELVGQPADVGAPVQAAVALIGLSLKTAVFVLEAGVKLTAKVVVGIGHLATKA